MWEKCHNWKTQTCRINKFRVGGKTKYEKFRKSSFVFVNFS